MDEKRGRGKGMSYDEFDYNKDLLREIINKKKEVQRDIEMTKTDLKYKIDNIPKPTYDVYHV
jgi:hypothetical protein